MNETALQNETQNYEHGIKDVLGIVKKEEITENIMKKVKDILGVAEAEESGDAIKTILLLNNLRIMQSYIWTSQTA